MLFISLPCAFFRDFNVPPTVSVSPQPKFIINLWVYMHVIVLIIFKCMKF